MLETPRAFSDTLPRRGCLPTFSWAGDTWDPALVAGRAYLCTRRKEDHYSGNFLSAARRLSHAPKYGGSRRYPFLPATNMVLA